MIATVQKKAHLESFLKNFPNRIFVKRIKEKLGEGAYYRRVNQG